MGHFPSLDQRKKSLVPRVTRGFLDVDMLGGAEIMPFLDCRIRGGLGKMLLGLLMFVVGDMETGGGAIHARDNLV